MTLIHLIIHPESGPDSQKQLTVVSQSVFGYCKGHYYYLSHSFLILQPNVWSFTTTKKDCRVKMMAGNNDYKDYISHTYN